MAVLFTNVLEKKESSTRKVTWMLNFEQADNESISDLLHLRYLEFKDYARSPTTTMDEL